MAGRPALLSVGGTAKHSARVLGRINEARAER